MKRITSVGLIAATSSCLVLAVVPTATAQTQVATFNLNQQSPVTVTNRPGIVDALTGLAGTTTNIFSNNATPHFEHKPGQLNIVFDPSSIPGLFKALSSSSSGAQLSPTMRGHTASGAEVVFPTTGTYTSGFGSRWGAQHNGIDIANAIGTPIVAVMDGTVIDAGAAAGFGNWIRIRHDDGSVSIYGHMQADQLVVTVGERVLAGQPIAAIGSEGQSTGPHLHFEIHPDGETPVDPQQWFSEQGISF